MVSQPAWSNLPDILVSHPVIILRVPVESDVSMDPRLPREDNGTSQVPEMKKGI